MSERVRARHNIEDFKLMMSSIDQQVDEQVKNIIESGHIILKGAEFNVIRIKLTWGLYSLIGKDNFDKFRAEFNRYLPSLKMYYMMATFTPEPGSKPN